MIFPLFLDGLAVGSIYALVATGIVLLVKSTGVLNFAHGDFMMFSTFIAYAMLIQLKLPFVVAAIIAILFGAGLGIVTERLIIRRLIGGKIASTIMATLGVAFVLEGIAKIIWTDNVFRFPPFFPGGFIRIGNALISPQNLGVIISAIVILTILYFFLTYTKTGTGLRALTQNRIAATLMGVRVTRMYSLSWAVGGMLAAFAGILLAPRLFLSTGMGSITFTGIIAAVIGGFGSVYGAIIGGYLVGILSSVLPAFMPTEFQGVIPFVLLMLVLFIKPNGILGKPMVKKV